MYRDFNVDTNNVWAYCYTPIRSGKKLPNAQFKGTIFEGYEIGHEHSYSGMVAQSWFKLITSG